MREADIVEFFPKFSHKEQRAYWHTDHYTVHLGKHIISTNSEPHSPKFQLVFCFYSLVVLVLVGMNIYLGRRKTKQKQELQHVVQFNEGVGVTEKLVIETDLIDEDNINLGDV